MLLHSLQDKQTVSRRRPAFAGVLFIFLLAWEWLRPLLSLTDTFTIQPFLIFLAFILFMKWLQAPRWIQYGINGFLMFYMIHHLYYMSPFFSKEWLSTFKAELTHSIQLLFQLDFIQHDSAVRTMLFLIALWIIAAYIYSLTIHKQRAFPIFLWTVVFLTILDTFSPYQAAGSVVRSILIGFSLLMYIHIERVIKQVLNERTKHVYEEGDPERNRSFPVAWFLAGMAVIFLSTSVAFLAPKAAPSWPDPVTFIQGYSEFAGTGSGPGIKRIGYGDQDERLGGPFIMDDGLVFTAETQQRGYWRGESKEIYTGKGWVNGGLEEHWLEQEQMNQAMKYTVSSFQLVDEDTTTTPNTIKIEFEEARYSNIFYTGQPKEIYVPRQGRAFVDRLSGLIRLFHSSGAEQRVQRYLLETEVPTYAISDLEEVSHADPSIPLIERYTQLPESLPQRVRELALEIVEDKESYYQQVKAIENYLRSSEFTYDTEDVAIPSEDEDYVDQFLFETHQGYCDNFSTSMVVLLRTLDIPARWVKGFTFGDITDRYDGQMATEVRNANAHSWVEVYFPQVGWVPFEPTRSFYNPYTFEREDTETSEQDRDNLMFDPLEDEFDPGLEEELDMDMDFSFSPSQARPWYLQPTFLTLSILILCFLLIGTFVYRRNVVLAWALFKYKKIEQSDRLEKIYQWLIRFLGYFILKRNPSDTIREYIQKLDDKLNDQTERNELVSFTHFFEELRYGKRPPHTEHLTRAHQIWRAVIKKLQQASFMKDKN